MQVVEIVLHFAVGEFSMDEVAKLVVVIARAVVGFQAVVGDGGAGVWQVKVTYRERSSED